LSARQHQKNLYTIMVVPHSEKHVHNFSVHLAFIQAVCFVLVAMGMSLLVLANLYLEMRSTAREVRELRSVNREQRQQIKSLAEETEAIRGNMILLTELDRQLRDLVRADPDFARIRNIPPLAPLGLVAGSQPLTPTVVSVASADRTAPIVSRSAIDRGQRLSNDLVSMKHAMAYQERSLESLRSDLYELRSYQACRPSLPPVLGTITSYFGMRASPFGWGREFHGGLDIAAQYGTPIISAGDGVVTFTGLSGAYGRCVQIDHGYGYVSMYGHTSKINVLVGQRVKKGEIIAWVGNSGRSSGPHVHYEVRFYSKLVDPWYYIIRRAN
jgi:septal ring factor EnvC (AmiA/AmiB activator)